MKNKKCDCILKTYIPDYYDDLCNVLEKVIDKIEAAKTALSKELISAQKRNEFDLAREIIDTQEELTEWSRKILELHNDK